jgi:hypothetical protein
MSCPCSSEAQAFCAWVFIPSDFGRNEGSSDHVDSSVSVDIHQEVSVTLHVSIPIFDVSEWTRCKGWAWIPVAASNDVRFSISIDISDSATFVRIESQGFDLPTEREVLWFAKWIFAKTAF